ncbi:MAG: DNA adenine methylase [Flavobacteriales bacterium]|nr:DNA adenine methylase [Flavobacteriales bacterium]
MKKPFETYFGGKGSDGTFQTIINQVPKCSVFVELMAGNGTIGRLLQERDIYHQLIVYFNDIDPVVTNAFVSAGLNCLNEDYKYVLEEYFHPSRINLDNVVFYCDPPYLKSTRKSQDNRYRFEWTDEQHIEFLEIISEAKSKVMVSHYPSELYDTFLGGWRKIEFQSQKRHGLATECLWMNYPEPIELQTYDFLGKNYTDRQRIKRKRERFVKKIMDLPMLERKAILEEIENFN